MEHDLSWLDDPTPTVEINFCHVVMWEINDRLINATRGDIIRLSDIAPWPLYGCDPWALRQVLADEGASCYYDAADTGDILLRA